MDVKHACNICQDDATQLLHLDEVPPLQNRFSKNFDDAKKFAATEVDFLWCQSCQHISINKTQTVQFDQYYDNKQTASPFVVAQYKQIVSDIEQQVPCKDARIVEIGCGRGELLEMLRDSGYKSLRGFDPAAPVATDMISNTYWDISVQRQGIDLIIVRHTIEEIQEPNPFIDSMVKALNQEGWIYCEITNAPNLLDDKGIFSLYPEYSNIFSTLSIARLYAKNGLSVEKVTSINEGEWLGIWGKKRCGFSGGGAADLLNVVYEKILKLQKPIVLWGGGSC